MSQASTQPLHIVFGGELEDLSNINFPNTDDLDIIGIFPDYHEAYNAWKSAAQSTVDNAMMRYFIVPLHYYLDPASEEK